MFTRKLGKTKIEVSEIGFGAWAIGGDAWGPVDDGQSLRAMEAAVELGVNFIDTADVYGDGRSEQLVAKLIEGRRNELVVSTKGGLMGHHRDPNGEPVYGRPAKVIEAFENSLKRLGTDYIDVYFCHLWWDKQEETEAFIEAFKQLKRDGKVRAVGVSTENFDYIKHFNREGGLDAVQLDYSVLNRSVESEVLPYLEQHGIGAVVRGPLRMGILTGKFHEGTTFGEGDIRRNWPKETWFADSLAKVETLKGLVNEERTLSQAALRFVLNHPAISVAIPGAKTAEQAAQNVSASARPLLSDEDLSIIARVK
ncbi:aldo/keto reductase [Paenibacillus sacheonensis]|uniref:Aldo/keto reductase n=1 Tax=Paenibacillus sacheonensis TaxID=742054 RepID=A0A7X4YUX3_9BACL|nr:aldo/keto reductase [Paenibacillus sacheonensis]MBM7567673.1 aryl-alcohol dehydrogenase-like predicted oxidoreductase [Paenibacillus sacheonensis]NBC72051.1 aldo/keto reductase [Paenibacillus sacheonensis]